MFVRIIVGIVILGVRPMLAEGETHPPLPPPELTFAIPAPASGKIVSVRALGPDRPLEPRVAVVATASEPNGTVLPVQHPRFARWRAPDELLIHASIRPSRDGSGNRVFRYSLSRGEMGDLADRNGLGTPFPSPDGNLVALARVGSEPAEKGLAIYPLVAEPVLGLRLGDPKMFRDPSAFQLAWNVDSRHLAVSVLMATARGRLWPRLHLIDLASGEMRRIDDAVPPRKREPSGTWPLFWTKQGLFASSQRGVLRCDPDGAGCTSIYEPGEHWRVSGGTAVGDGKAYVLVTDLRPDPLETRANELHEVDLVNGGGKRILRTPANTFIEDIDWIAN